MPRIDSERGRESHRRGDYERGQEPHSYSARMMSPAVGVEDAGGYEQDLEYLENQDRLSPPSSNERFQSEDSQEARRNHPVTRNRQILAQDSNARKRNSSSQKSGCCIIL